VKRTEIAVRGAPSTDALRLELNGCPEEEGLVLELLHDDRQTGTLARVLEGRVGLGEVGVPVAVKLQRDMALSQEDRGSVAAKFDKERNVHRRLQDCAEGAAGQERIVRQLEVWKGSEDHEADSLEPCILCSRARHGLAPRCPECKDPTALLEELQLTDDRGLRCSRCHRQFWSTPKTRDAILQATLGHDQACRNCALANGRDPDGCRRSAVFLNFFRNRVLLLERLDLDLEDYLRWRRGQGPSVTRKAAQRAFEEHRRRWQERRDQLPGPSVRKIADLLMTADLFSDILAGVEHLHRHGVAHLDLKLANLCVRFRGADLEVKIIDLGLSDDPHTLAYLRQAEGPLSLWTDFSSPEFRRPRAHPMMLDGRFAADFCELDWPSVASAPLELPCPGDLLFFEEPALAQQPWRVLGVQPGRDGRLLVQARAEAHHRPWLGEVQSPPLLGPGARACQGLGVVLEKHCGFPADVYSLGMLLLSVLAEQSDVGDFREALPGVQIELEEHLQDHSSLPSRALVQRLLSKPSKHLQVFHAYARRLESFGIAQPFAEELLGVVLRATLRGSSPIFYLSNRGADARPALRRLRADLDAVRNAIRNALTAAQAAAVREARLAVLDQLRGLLQGRVVETAPSRPDPAHRLVYPTLDLGAAGDEQCVNELAYLSPLTCQPASVLDRWEQELGGLEEDSSSAGRAFDFLQRYCRVFDLEGSEAKFLKCYGEFLETVQRNGLPTDQAQAEDRERVRHWMDDHQALAERLECGARFVERFRYFLTSLKDELLTPWDRALRTKHYFFLRRHAVRVPLSRGERTVIRDEEIAAALDRLVQAAGEGIAVREQRAKDFENALAKWRAWHTGRRWLDALTRLETDALRQWQALGEGCELWEQNWNRSIEQVRGCLSQITDLLHAYAPLTLANSSREEVSARLTRSQREALDLAATEEALVWLERNWPAPGEKVECLFALSELGLSPD
jgi:hypothetical protein